MNERTQQEGQDQYAVANRTDAFHSLGFESEREYRLYLEIKHSLQQPVQIGIAA